jgi:hypothetical protein
VFCKRVDRQAIVVRALEVTNESNDLSVSAMLGLHACASNASREKNKFKPQGTDYCSDESQINQEGARLLLTH